MDQITCVLIEDEKRTRTLLKALLEKYCEGVTVLAEAANVQEGVEAINQHSPDMVFLDIEMPKESGFSLFKYFEKINFEVVFTTAYAQYAVRAIKLAALDYLVKPISLEELMDTLQRYRAKRKEQNLTNDTQRQILESSLQKKEHQRIALPCTEGLVFVEIGQILRCQSDKSYTIFYLESGKQIWTSKNLGEYAEMLADYGFVRVHRSHLVNTTFVQSLSRGKTPTLIMEDGSAIPVANAKKDELLEHILGR